MLEAFAPATMARRSRQQSRRPAGRDRTGWLWLVPALVLAALLWLWWNPPEVQPPGPTEPKAPPPTPTPKARPPAAPSPPAIPAPTRPVPPPPEVPRVSGPETFPRPVQNVLEAQLALERLGFSAGSHDGAIGSQTRAALRAFQRSHGLPVTGELDAATKAHLSLDTPPLTTYVVTGDDLARLRPLGKTWLEKSRQDRLEYETILELVAEQAHAHPNLIRRLNPAVNWSNIVAGTVVTVPNASLPPARGRAARVRIHLASRTLEVFDDDGKLILHFPCSIGSIAEKRPVGELHVAVIAPNPNYTFNPEIFPESAEARALDRKLILAPGPNNPVGVAWIGLDRPGYGIHGTPWPEAVGRTESHGCFRLANWNAAHLLQLSWVGMPVVVEP
jgi:lipoprotein-anchoring transpeptidase ErfK/SrfK